MPIKKVTWWLVASIIVSTVPFWWLLIGFQWTSFATDQTVFWSDLALLLAAVLGYVGTVFMIWELILGVRPLAGLFTDDLQSMNLLHKWIGKYGMLLVFIHPLLEMYVYAENILWIFVPKIDTNIELHYTFGRVALILLLLIYVTSALLRGKIAYRPWKYIHYLSYVLIPLVFLHALDIGSIIQQNPAIKAFWFSWFTLFLVLIVYRVMLWAGLTKKKYILVSKSNLAGDVTMYDFEPQGSLITPVSGQFVYIQLESFGESHPFSILFFNKVTGHLTLGIRTVGSFTRKMSELVEGSEVMIDGPYGVFTREAVESETRVILAGGVGIVPFVDLVSKVGSDDTFVLNASRDIDQVIARDWLKRILGGRYFDFISDNSRNEPNVINSRITGDYIRNILGNKLLLADYFICGSPGFNEGMKQMLATLNVPIDQIFIEDFSL